MKQYCRYCCYLYTENGIWCDKLGKEIREAVAKSPNRCHSFAYNPIDAFNMDKTYSPRVPKKLKKTQCDGQMNMF